MLETTPSWAPLAGAGVALVVEAAKRLPQVPLDPQQHRAVQTLTACLALVCALAPQLAGYLPPDVHTTVATALVVWATALATYWGAIRGGSKA